MKTLSISTRHRNGAFEGEARLLVYDSESITDFDVADDVRKVLDNRPSTLCVYILAPFARFEEVVAAVRSGASLRRVGVDGGTGEIAVVGLRATADSHLEPVFQKLVSGQAKETDAQVTRLDDELRDGWLFDLFDKRKCLVDAPPGVHFGKASNKHSDRFLRTSSALLSAAACGLIAFFALAALGSRMPRRILVDTAPVLAIAFAMHRIARALGCWAAMPSSSSFSSYGGIDDLPRLTTGDAILISASTSGGLATKLVERGADGRSIVTLYMLRSDGAGDSAGLVLCDLTYRPGRPFGYPPVRNDAAASCALCAKGFVLAELEGDQFLLERRAVKRLAINAALQAKDARTAVEALSKNGAVNVRLYDTASWQPAIRIDAPRALSAVPVVRDAFVRLLRRYVPTPLTHIILVGVSTDDLHSLSHLAGIERVIEGASVLSGEGISALAASADGNALVLIGALDDHAKIRGINAQLRTLLPGGCVAYLSAVTVADSPRSLKDIRTFLGYGEHGADTFTFKAALEVMLPSAGDVPSAWSAEVELLDRLATEVSLPPPLTARRHWLTSTGEASSQLFLPGIGGELKIARDFVFLSTDDGKIDQISQADIFLVVSNLLASARCNGRGLQQATGPAAEDLAWSQTVYGQVVVCPSNFRKFNDAVLRASMLRCAFPAELNYSVEEQASSEMLAIIQADIKAWDSGRGDSLPEFLVAIASGRLQLMRRHVEAVVAEVLGSSLPEHLKLLASAAVGTR